MTADLRRLVKNCGDALNTLVFKYSKYPSGKEITKKQKKTECLRRKGYISPPVQCLPP